MKSLSRVWLLATLCTAAHQVSPPMRFSRQEYWSGLPWDGPRQTQQHSPSLLHWVPAFLRFFFHSSGHFFSHLCSILLIFLASPAPLTARILQVCILSLVLHSCSHLGRKFALGSVLGSWDASPWRCALGSSLVGKQGGNRDHEEVITVCSEAWEGEEGQRRAGEVSGTYPVCHPPCPLPSTSHGGSGLLPRLLWSPKKQLCVLHLQIPTWPLTKYVWTRVSLIHVPSERRLPDLPASLRRPVSVRVTDTHQLPSREPSSPCTPSLCTPPIQSPTHAGTNPPCLSMPPSFPYSRGRHTLPVCWNGFSGWCVGKRKSFGGVLGWGEGRLLFDYISFFTKFIVSYLWLLDKNPVIGGTVYQIRFIYTLSILYK